MIITHLHPHSSTLDVSKSKQRNGTTDREKVKEKESATPMDRKYSSNIFQME